jgi:hypothetical protein
VPAAALVMHPEIWSEAVQCRFTQCPFVWEEIESPDPKVAAGALTGRALGHSGVVWLCGP